MAQDRSAENTGPAKKQPKELVLKNYHQMKDASGARSYLIDGLLPTGSLSLIFGDSGIGKSFISLDIALSIVSGKKWLSRFATGRGDVVYMLGEGGAGMARRVEGWLKRHAVDESEIAGFRMCDDPFEIGRSEREGGDIERLIEKLSVDPKPSLIVIDTFGLAMSGDENSNSDINQNCRQLRRLIKSTQAAVMLIHHTGKPFRGANGKTFAQTSARGGSALQAHVDTVWHVRKIAGEEDNVECAMIKQRDGRISDPLWLKFTPAGDTEDPLGKYPEHVEYRARTPRLAGERLPEKEVELLRVLCQETLPEGLPRRQGDYALRLGIGAPKLSKIVSSLEKDGFLERTKIGRAYSLTVTESGRDLAR